MNPREPSSFDPPDRATPPPDDGSLLGAKGDPAEGKRGHAAADDQDAPEQDRQEDRPAP
jgi:hypothetical protein